MKRTNLLWGIVLILGWLFDFLFWEHTPGINFALYVVLCLAGGFLVLGLNGLRPAWKSLLLLIPILFFAVMTFLRREPLSLFLGYAFPLVLMALLASSYLGGRWTLYSLADYVANAARLVGSAIGRPLSFLFENRKPAEVDGQPVRKSGWKRFWAVLRGLLIALPVVAVFAALLSSADLVFADKLQEFVKLFRLENLPEYIFRLVYILIFAYLLAGTLLHAAQKSNAETLTGIDKPLVPPFLGFTEAAMVLGAVVALFAAFVFIQFQYFFGGQTNIGIEGYTYSEYARRGFGELVTVAFFSLLLFLGLSGITRRTEPVQRRVFSGLGLGMLALVGVMLVSAFQRLMLYEAAYGFSRLRTYTHIFLIWLGALLAALVILELLRKERRFALFALLAAIGFGASLALVNVDGFIARRNLERAAAGQDLDVGYLASLSVDSVPALVVAYQDDSLPASLRDGVGAALACRIYDPYAGEADTNWRAFTLARLWADRALAQVRDRMGGYHLLSDSYPVQVESPQGEVYECWGYMD
jgi:hypothetical protein